MGKLTAHASRSTIGNVGFDPNDPWQLLDVASVDSTGGVYHEQSTTPLFLHNALEHAEYRQAPSQYGLPGQAVSIESKDNTHVPPDPRIYVNTLECAILRRCVRRSRFWKVTHCVGPPGNMFVPNITAIGSLQQLLSGLILHYGEGGLGSHPSEVAFLALSNFRGVKPPPVKVFVSASSINTMRQVHAPLGEGVVVEPLRFTEEEPDAQAFLSMMSVGSSSSAPLYIQTVLSILRDLGEGFNLQSLEAELVARKFKPAQVAGLDQRMALLRSFITRKPKKRTVDTSRFAAGQLSIVDFSDPFIDPASASRKVLVVDEAHKYLSTAPSGMTHSLLRLVREQRHLGMRVIIFTQEPTATPPVLLDLCTVSIMHRFSSPAWWEHPTKHVSASFSGCNAFDEVVTLRTGEALILAPSAMIVVPNIPNTNIWDTKPANLLERLGRRYMIVKTRARVTVDGGASVLVVE